MSYSVIFGVSAGIFSFAAYIFYIVAIIRGTTKPNRTTWWIWGVIGVILLASYYYSGATTTIWVPVSESIAPLIIALLSLKYGEGGPAEKLDFLCIFGAGISCLLWYLTGSAVVALVTNLAIDFFAAIPTVAKSWSKPEEEDRFAWTLTSTGNVLNMLAVNSFTFAILIYPVYTLIIDGIITGFLYRKVKTTS